MRPRLLPFPALVGGAAAGLALGVSNVIIWITRGPLGLLNDFYIYWSAAAPLNQGGNPYNTNALAHVHDLAGVPGLIGGGYSYPLLFAQVLRPLALLPAPAAGAVFMATSLLAVAGAADAISAIARNTIQQTLAPDRLRGRLSAVYSMVVVGGPYLGDARAGAVASAFSAPSAVVAGGVMCLVGCLAVRLAFPEMWRYHARNPGDTAEIEPNS